MLRHLREYSTVEGHANIPLGYELVERDHAGYEVDGRCIRLGVWLSKQWTEWQGKRLSHARMVQLADAGVDWDGPAPPASGAVRPRQLNERKWDVDRSAKLAAQHIRKPFDASKPAHEPAWSTYDAAKDPHARRWRREHGIKTRPATAHPPLSIHQYGGKDKGDRSRGLPPQLGLRLQQAKVTLAAERAAAKRVGQQALHRHFGGMEPSEASASAAAAESHYGEAAASSPYACSAYDTVLQGS